MGGLLQERRTQLFSATMTSKVQKLQRACLHDPAKVEVDQKYKTVSTLRQQYLFIPAKHKVRRSPFWAVCVASNLQLALSAGPPTEPESSSIEATYRSWKAPH